jgi:hypothetical protein
MSAFSDHPAPSPITAARAFMAEGARIALCSCRICGAALVLDPGDQESVVELHVAWHLARRERPERPT